MTYSHSGNVAELVLAYGGGTALVFHQASPNLQVLTLPERLSA
jgi:hypothetical protein